MKRAILLVTDSFLIGFMQYVKDPNIIRRWKVIENPIPDDAKPIRAFQTKQDGMLGIVLESESFEDVDDCRRYPILPRPVFSSEEDDSVKD